jgi:hypothetical protein
METRCSILAIASTRGKEEVKGLAVDESMSRMFEEIPNKVSKVQILFSSAKIVKSPMDPAAIAFFLFFSASKGFSSQQH